MNWENLKVKQRLQQNVCCFCLNKDLLCSSEMVPMNSEILKLLKFLIVNVNIEALENVVVGMGCLGKIADACEYKYKNSRVSSRISKDKRIESDTKKSIICQKCKTALKRNDASLLVDCVTLVDWSDFVSYLFENQDLELLGNSRICNSCRTSVVDMQHFLKLLYVYDQSKMYYYNNDSCDDTKAIENKNSAESEIEIKEEIESKDLITNEHIAMTQIHNDKNDYLSYENFKLKNEEIDLKFECNDDDSDQSTHGCENVEVGKQISSNKSYVNIANKQREHKNNYLEVNDLEKVKKDKLLECEVNSITNQIKRREVCRSRGRGDNNRFTCHLKQNIEIKDGFKRNLGAKMLDDDIANKTFMMQKNNSQPFKCQYCTYKTRYKVSLTRHIKIHKNIKDFKCTFCSKAFTRKDHLEIHLFRIHKCKDVRKKLYNCDHCSCEYLTKWDLLQHKIQHGITEGIPILKCYQCPFETYQKYRLNQHVKIHQNIKDFKCIYCPKEFTQKNDLDVHLFRIHKYKDFKKKLYNCDQCSYKFIDKKDLLQHKIRHGITEGIPILKCYHCTFETYHKNSLIGHIKIHQNIKDFKCTYCPKEFTQKKQLDAHLFRIHKCRDFSKKLYNCDQCSYKSMDKRGLLRHKIKHGITDGFPILKCYQCTYETYIKSSLISHVKIHQSIKDFKCIYCSKEFALKSTLITHIKIHKNIKEFKCTYCPKEFSRKIQLKNHLLKNHKCRNLTEKSNNRYLTKNLSK